MTTSYRKEQAHTLLKNVDTINLSLYQNEVRQYLHATHARTNCLVGFTVFSILVGSAALAISTFLFLQKLDIIPEQNGKLQELQRHVYLLGNHTEILQQILRDTVEKLEQVREQTLEDTGTTGTRVGTGTARTTATTAGTSKPRDQEGNTATNTTTTTTTTTEDNRKWRYQNNEGRRGGPGTPLQVPPVRNPSLPPSSDDEDYEGNYEEGSGDGCPINPPRPKCPNGMRLCIEQTTCPTYVCCSA